jgi:hypothetical protein
LSLIPIEIKSGKTIASDALAGLNQWLSLAGDAASGGILIRGGEDAYRRNDIAVQPWWAFQPQQYSSCVFVRVSRRCLGRALPSDAGVACHPGGGDGADIRRDASDVMNGILANLP